MARNIHARRVLIENAIADTIGSFHLDALSSGVSLKVEVDLQLTLLAGTLYRLLAEHFGQSHEGERPCALFRYFMHASGEVVVARGRLAVRFARRAHNPVLEKTGLAD